MDEQDKLRGDLFVAIMGLKQARDNISRLARIKEEQPEKDITPHLVRLEQAIDEYLVTLGH